MAPKNYNQYLMSQILDSLDLIIDEERPNTFSTHLAQVFLFKNRSKVCGSREADKVFVWLSEMSLTGALYPIITVKLGETNNKVSLSSKINPVGKIVWIVVNLFLWYGISSWGAKMVEGTSFIASLVPQLLFLIAMNIPLYIAYKIPRDELYKEIEIILWKKNAANKS